MFKNLYEVLFKAYPRKILYFSILGLIAGTLNVFLITLINNLIENIIGNRKIDLVFSILSFFTLIALFFYFKRSLFLKITTFSQENLFKFRARLVNHILNDTGYNEIAVNREKLYNIIIKDIDAVSRAGNVVSECISNIVLIMGSYLYMAYISGVLFAISFSMMFFGVTYYYLNNKKIIVFYSKARKLNDQFIFYFNQLIHGFREIKIAKEKGLDLEENYLKRSLTDYYKELIIVNKKAVNSHFMGIIVFYLFIGFLLLFGSTALHVNKEQLVPYAFIMLYIINPIESLISSIPVLGDADSAAKRVLDLNIKFTTDVSIKRNTYSGFDEEFQSLELNDLSFEHKTDSSHFKIGPISMKIKSKEITFIHGSNGSGKTSLILCILGIYKYDSGAMLVNGCKIAEKHYSLFAPVFSDFFLFDKFYGNKNIDIKKADYYLKLFELDSKVKIEGNVFSTLRLSIGQRKRLALIHALLDEKPIIILDEWAADQDPYFREKFYTIILTKLKEEGKTIIAITHDDKYFQHADNIYKMEFGKITNSTKPKMYEKTERM